MFYYSRGETEKRRIGASEIGVESLSSSCEAAHYEKRSAYSIKRPAFYCIIPSQSPNKNCSLPMSRLIRAITV